MRLSRLARLVGRQSSSRAPVITPPAYVVARNRVPADPECTGEDGRRYLTDDESDRGLIPILAEQDAVPEQDRIGKMAKSGFIHVTALSELCPREWLLMAQNDNPEEVYKRATGNDRIVWSMGRAAEQGVRDRLIEGMGVRAVIGTWSCGCGKSRTRYTREEDMPTENQTYALCPFCNTAIANYHENELIHREAGVIGHCDFAYYDRRGDVVVAEIKSINKDDFERLAMDRAWSEQPTAALKTLMAAHLYQVFSYRKLFEHMGIPVSPRVRLLYVSKGYRRGSPYKEYSTPIAPAIEDRIARDWENAKQWQELRRRGELPPPLSVCSSPDTTRAKNCRMVGRCFNCR